jgi:hypothetical protein
MSFWSENGGENISKAFERFLKDHGIRKQIVMAQEDI